MHNNYLRLGGQRSPGRLNSPYQFRARFQRNHIKLYGRTMNICISLLLCMNLFSFVTAQERKDVSALIQQMQDQNKQVRIAAIKEIKRLGIEAKAAIPALTLMLKA